MSATPEQIAERLVTLVEAHFIGANEQAVKDAAALIRAQSEREKVLVEAASNLMTLVEPMVSGNTDFSVTWRKYVREMRAALAGAR